MNMKEVTEKLRKEVQTNKAADAVMHVLAARQRGRGVITTRSLHLKMKKEGFNLPKDDYAGVLNTLGALGIGQVDKDSKGRVRALKGIKVSLPSLGRAVCNKNAGSVKGFTPRNRFVHFSETAPTPTPVKEVFVMPMTLGIPVGKRRVVINVPEDLSVLEFAELLHKLKKLG